MFSELMLLYCPRIKRCDKLMAVLLFYSVIKFLLITLTQRSTKGHTVSGGSGLFCYGNRRGGKEMWAHQCIANMKRVFIMQSERKRCWKLLINYNLTKREHKIKRVLVK